MQRNMIKQQLEQILKDTKILCELEPFVKKWSFDEMLPNFEISNSIHEDKLTLTEILRDVKLKKGLSDADNNDDDDDHVREHLLRKLKGEKEIMMVPKGNNDDPSHSATISGEICMDNLLLGDQYDHELEKTLKAAQEIEIANAVTQADIDDFIRGLGGKPDGLDLKTTNIREWKNIFLERWLDLNHLAMVEKSNFKEKTSVMIKQKESLPNIIKRKSPIKKDHHQDVVGVRSQKSADHFSVCTSSRVNLDGHFMTRKERKNMATSPKLHVAQGESTKNGLRSTSSSPYFFAENQGGGATVVPVDKKKSLLTLQKQHNEKEKIANSALTIGKLPINGFKASGDKFYGDRERQTKKMGQNNCVNEVQLKAQVVTKKTKNTPGQKDSQSHIHSSSSSNLKEKKVQASVRPSSAVPICSPIPVGLSKLTASVAKGKIR